MNSPMQSAPVTARPCPRLSILVGRQSCDWLQCAGKVAKLRDLVYSQSAEPGLHFLPRPAVGYLQELLLAALLQLARRNDGPLSTFLRQCDRHAGQTTETQSDKGGHRARAITERGGISQ